jgi:peptide/nickel transport system substrate-binding protein
MRIAYTLILACLPLIACGSGEGGPGRTLKNIPRNRTLIMDCAEGNTCAGQIQDYNTFNPFIPGGISRIGYNFLYEPLYFFNAYKEDSELIPWIAESHTFNDDNTEIIIKIRPGVEWSDGHPWSAHDFAFTVNMLKDNAPQLMHSTDMEAWVKEAVALDSLTAKITLKTPNPRFLFSYFVHSGDQGVPIVPKHIWEGQNPMEFSNYDLQKGWPVLTGPYEIAASEPAQRIWDLRPNWWAKKLGFQELPKVERLIYLTYMEENKRVQNLIANNIDTCLELRPANIVSLLDANPNITTWTGREPPYSYITWWPISLGFNGLEAPWSDSEMRRAVNYAINREQLVEIGWQNSGDWTHLPLPDLPQMRKYFTWAEDLVAKHQVGVFDLEKSAAILSSKGYSRTGEFWEKDGQTLSMVIDIFSHFQDLTPVLIAQLKKAGIDATFRMTSDFNSRLRQGTARAYMIGNFSSMKDPYFVSEPLRTTHRPGGRYALALEKCGLRRVDRSDGPDPDRRSGDGDALSPGNGHLACRVALNPHRAVATPHPAQRDLLDQLALGG